MCDHAWIHTEYSKICEQCGIEQIILKVDRYNKYSAPLQRGYDRCGRFKIKLDKLYGRHSGPKMDDPVWAELESIKYKLRNPDDIRKALRLLKVANKHYDCIRIFSDIFTKFRVTILDSQESDIILFKFRSIHAAWRRHRSQQQFFSYDYLLRHLLDELKSPLVVYCKPQTNKRRRLKYEKKLNLIRVQSADRMSNHTPVVSHSHYVSMQPSIRLYRQCVAEGRVELPVEEDLNHNVNQMGCREPFPPNNSERLQDDTAKGVDASFHERMANLVVPPSQKDSDEDTCEWHRGISAFHLASLRLLES